MKLDAIGELLGKTWARLRAKWVPAVEIIAVPAALLLLAESLLMQGTGLAIALAVLLGIVSIVMWIAASISLIALFGGVHETFASAYRRGFELFWSTLWIIILIMVATLGGYMMLIIPGIMLAVQLSWSSFVLVLEGKRGISALNLSREYMKGYWWAYVGRLLLLVLISLVVHLVIQLPLQLLFGPVVGVVVSIIILVAYVIFALPYQLEIFENLRRLKPDAVEAAAKTDSGFLKVSMVVGIVAAAMLIVAGVALAIFLPSMLARSEWHTQYGGYTDQNPGMFGESPSAAMLTPTSGPIGTTVVISGLDSSLIGDTETMLMDNLVAAQNVAVTDDGSGGGMVTFIIPANLAPNCDPTQPCPQFLELTSPGTYSISLEDSMGDSPVIEGNFTVTSDGSSTSSTGETMPLQ